MSDTVIIGALYKSKQNGKFGVAVKPPKTTKSFHGYNNVVWAYWNIDKDEAMAGIGARFHNYKYSAPDTPAWNLLADCTLVELPTGYGDGKKMGVSATTVENKVENEPLCPCPMLRGGVLTHGPDCEWKKWKLKSL